MSRASLNSRLYLIFILFILLFIFIIARLFYVQIAQAPRLKELASRQHRVFTEIQPQRGGIFDSRHKALAVNAIAYSIFATAEFNPPLELKKQIVSILGLDQDALTAKIDSDKDFVWLKRKISPETSAKIQALNIPGIHQIREYKRFYPNGSLASQIVGFTDIDNRGLEGIELYCDSYLCGIKGWRLAEKDAKRRELICWGYQTILPTDGYNVVLTIDSVIQNIAEKYLRQAARKYKAASGSAIVIEPKTGEILAFCNYPDYNLNHFSDAPASARRNLAVTDIFEPGSSFKFVSAAAAIEESKVKLEDQFFCEQGRYRIGGRILHDYRPYGELTFKEVIEHSSNIGIVKVAQLLGSQALYDYILDFGFGALSGVDLPGEVKGIVRPPQKWSRVSISSVPLGQEVAVTPLQLVNAVACIANDGILLRPKIIQAVQDKEGNIIKAYPREEVRRVVSTQTARLIKEALTGVVEKGTGKRAKVSGYQTAGKTGTAQKAKPSGGYYRRKYVSSFVGFVPVDQPRIAILVVLNEPSGQYFGGRVCAPVFKKIATETLRYLKMANETEEIN